MVEPTCELKQALEHPPVINLLLGNRETRKRFGGRKTATRRHDSGGYTAGYICPILSCSLPAYVHVTICNSAVISTWRGTPPCLSLYPEFQFPLSYLLLADIGLLGCSSRKDGGLESSSGSSIRDRTTTGKNNNYSSKELRDLT